MKKLLIALMLAGTFGLTYAQSDYYNDYRRSIADINWQTVAADLLLSATQTNQLNSLNDRYRDYDSWNRVYVSNPDRWREDRYYEIERILGREKYAKFKNKYYKGQNPVAVYNRNKNNYKKYNSKQYKEYRKEYKKEQKEHEKHGKHH
ncbi:hypothetical protein ACM40_05330 [Chryseobacterium sp. BLS98]|jgi:hypothetical protein|uniref:hypothetical protein n=1 Tax=Chryseobacterium sp. BLS98 TaxID=885586 RepID=UPI00065ACA57|nr:hypothetical protein [Chryseobacterium sp. BLS98]KMQ61756.1 hypothetical protein ACM40_05330 [Chryseobacterium sp. BLS98]